MFIVHCRYDNGSYVTGTWNHGIRHGPFTFDTNKQESEVMNSSVLVNISSSSLPRCPILRVSTRTIALKGWSGCNGRMPAGPRASTREASSMASPGASTLTSSSPLSGCTGGLN